MKMVIDSHFFSFYFKSLAFHSDFVMLKVVGLRETFLIFTVAIETVRAAHDAS